MNKVLNILMFIFVVFFTFAILRHYSSSKNIENKYYIRSNIDKILKKKISDLPFLMSDTNNVIEFNDKIENEINSEKTRSIWDLLKTK